MPASSSLQNSIMCAFLSFLPSSSECLSQVEDAHVAVSWAGGQLQKVRVKGEAAHGPRSVAKQALLVLDHVQLGAVGQERVDGHILKEEQ